MDSQETLDRTKRLVDLLGFGRKLRVVDVGANPLVEGEVSYQKLLDGGYAEVVGFEPQEHALAALLERKSDAETYLPYALGSGASQTLHLCRSSGFTSVFPADPRSAQYLGFTRAMSTTGQAELATHRMDDLAEIGRVDFLKIDVQGSETNIIRHGKRTLSNAVAIQTEVRFFPLYQGEPSYGDLEQAMTDCGFRFLKLVGLKHVSAAAGWRSRLKRSMYSQAVDGDGFFLRDLRDPDAYSDDQLQALCLLADAIMDAPDVALLAIDVLVQRGAIVANSAETYLSFLPANWLRN